MPYLAQECSQTFIAERSLLEYYFKPGTLFKLSSLLKSMIKVFAFLIGDLAFSSGAGPHA